MKTMKKTLLLMVLMIGLAFLNQTQAQLTAASATWGLVGATGLTVATAGQLTGTPETYSGLKFGSPAYKVVGTDTMQRMQATGSGWPANTTSKIDTIYVQFAVTPKQGNIFHANSISLGIASLGSVSTMKADIYYSTDPTFATATLISYSTGVVDYTNSSTGAVTTNPLSGSAITTVNATIDESVTESQTFYVRVYPWVDQDPLVRTGKYIGLKNLVISGQTESVPVASSVIWPCLTDLSATTSGFMLAATPTLSNLLNYGYNLSTKGLAIYTGAAWPLETAPLDGRYIQFSAFPKTGGTLVVDSITLKMAAYSTASLRASVYYSTDANFTLATGTALLSDVVITSGAFSKSAGNLNLTVNSGDSIYVRIYPYHYTTDATDDKWKLVILNDVSIYGNVTGSVADPATIVNVKASYISTTFAKSGGSIPSDGGAAVTARGVCWSTNASPTIADTKTSDGTGSGAFTSKITGLTPGTLYHYRAYATNSTTTSYGGDSTFTTLAALVVPTVTKTTASNIMVIQAKAGGNATAWGGDSIVAKGVCWNITGNPTITDSLTVNGSDIGSFTGILYPLKQNTKYYYRAYATNDIGTGYSVVDSFTTQVPAKDSTVVVAKDGSGNFTTVQAAFNAVPLSYTGKFIIYVKPGTYYEKDTLLTGKVNVILRSIHPDSTIITYDAYADSPIKTGSSTTMGTSGCATLAIDADDFTAMNITIRNTKQNVGSGNLQAVALRSNGDRQSFFNCKIMGYQDTYYAWGGSGTGRVYMKNCYLEGSVDYIFGRDIVVFDSCQIHTNRQGGAVTAPSTDAASSFGFVFRNCQLTSPKAGTIDFSSQTMVGFYLGRPWQSSPQCVYIKCYEPATLYSAGWTIMQTTPLLFAEYKCYGPGSGTSGRSTANTSSTVASRQLTDDESLNYTISNIFSKKSNSLFAYSWIPDSTIYKFSQTIGSLPAKKYGDTTFVVKASSNLTATLSSSDTSIMAVRNDTTFLVKIAGTTTLNVSQKGNYLYSAAPDSVKTYTVSPITLTAAIDDKSKTYGEANPELTGSYSGTINGDDASTFITLSTTATDTSDAGTYPITANSSSTNYTVTATGTLTVNAAGLTVAIDDASKIYGAANPEFTATYTGLVNSDNASDNVSISSTATTASGVGTYPITASSKSGNYTLSTTDGTLTISPAALTITAKDASKKAGEANPVFELTYSGFVNGDDASDITVPTASCTANAESAVGDYTITLTGGSADNYTITLVNGTLTVTAASGITNLSTSGITIFPNPASEKITIKRNAASKTTLLIVNSIGEKVIEKEISSEQEDIDITSLPKGLYVLQLQGVSYKIVVQ
jgi:pectin methylesterase-like acyl-CoA thioesterase